MYQNIQAGNKKTDFNFHSVAVVLPKCKIIFFVGQMLIENNNQAY
jgi:hypothetical protein